MAKSFVNHFSTMTLAEIRKSIEAPVLKNVITTLSGKVAACPSIITIDSVELDPEVWGYLNDDDEEVRESEDTVQVYGRIMFSEDDLGEMQFTTWVEYYPEDESFMSLGCRCYLFKEPSTEKLLREKQEKEREEEKNNNK